MITYSDHVKVNQQVEKIPIEKCPICGKSHSLPLPDSVTYLVLGEATIVLTCPENDVEFKVIIDVEE